MNRHAVCATFVATIAATLALASTTASAGKPPPPPPPDPCASVALAAFPSFVFAKNITVQGAKVQTWGIFVADVTGKCQKLVATWPNSIDVNMRYSAGVALIVLGNRGSAFAGATVPISAPTAAQPVATFQNFFLLNQVPPLPDPTGVNAGWTLSNAGDPSLSVDGTQMLFLAFYNHPTLGNREVFWTCMLSPGPSIPDSTTNCHVVFLGGNNVQLDPWVTWGKTNETFYVTAPASTNSAVSSLYRLDNSGMTELWSRGTEFIVARATVDSRGHELVTVLEINRKSLCDKAFVYDVSGVADTTCTGGDTCILNGAGAPARSLVTWLPDGRLASGGQTAPNARGQCSDAGTIVSFGATDTNGTTTTLTPGAWVDGAGGG